MYPRPSQLSKENPPWHGSEIWQLTRIRLRLPSQLFWEKRERLFRSLTTALFTCGQDHNLNPFTPKSSAKFKTEGKNLEFHFANLSQTNSTTWKYCSLAFIWMHGHTLKLIEPHLFDFRLDPGSEGVKGALSRGFFCFFGQNGVIIITKYHIHEMCLKHTSRGRYQVEQTVISF